MLQCDPSGSGSCTTIQASGNTGSATNSSVDNAQPSQTSSDAGSATKSLSDTAQSSQESNAAVVAQVSPTPAILANPSAPGPSVSSSLAAAAPVELPQVSPPPSAENAAPSGATQPAAAAPSQNGPVAELQQNPTPSSLPTNPPAPADGAPVIVTATVTAPTVTEYVNERDVGHKARSRHRARKIFGRGGTH